MNKQNKTYLKDKLRAEIRAAKDVFAKGKPTNFSREEKIAKLKKAGFNVDAYATLSGINLPQSAQHLKNDAAITKYNIKLDSLLVDSIDLIELGDSKDALEVLATFRTQLKSI